MKKILLTLLSLSFSTVTFADLLTFSGQYAIELEEKAAAANQATYNQLLAIGCPDTSLDVASVACQDALTSKVWESVRELVHTANDLCDPLDLCGSSEFSLQVNLEALGKALRWTAGEEFSTQGDMANSFLSGQLTSLQARVSAIRSGASGFNLTGMPLQNSNDWIAMRNSGETGGSSGDEKQKWSPWGGFLNISYNWGNQGGSEREAAYDFDGRGFNGGFDYRLNNTWVIGTTFAVQKDRIDFDSEKSVVDGGVDMDAYSIIPFALYQSPTWFFLGSVGYQQSKFNTTRSIRYNSGNINIPDTNTTAVSHNQGNVITVSAGTGYTWSPESSPAFSIEPSFTVNYEKTVIDKFTERDLKNNGFNFLVDEQNYHSFETVAGLRLQYVFSPSAGVFVPFIEAQQHAQHEDQRYINATYAGAASTLTRASQFSLATNPVEDIYTLYTIGTSFILRGASQKIIDGPATGGLQGFISYSVIENIIDYTQNIVAGGLRYEF